MIRLTIRQDYLTVDTDEWIADRADLDTPDAQAAEAAFIAYQADHPSPFNTLTVREWLDTIAATGLYRDGPASDICTLNEENFLDTDIILILAHTTDYGRLLIWQYGYATTADLHFASFNRHDDADAYGYGNGFANCSYPACRADWIITGATTLWNNGGSDTVDISELLDAHPEPDDDTPRQITCPLCENGHLTFHAD